MCSDGPAQQLHNFWAACCCACAQATICIKQHGSPAVLDCKGGSVVWAVKVSHVRSCLQALMHTKAKYLIGQLRSLGFQDWQCAVAILQHGSHLEACIAFLLEDHVTSEEESRAYMVAHTLAPPIDVTEELQMLAEAQVLFHPLTITHAHMSPQTLCRG